MYPDYVATIKTSLEQARGASGTPALALCLFELFFERYPETQSYFQDTDIISFSPQKFNAIAEFFIDTVEHPKFAEYHVGFEVERHKAYGLSDIEYYYTLVDTFQQVVLDALEKDQRTANVEEAWMMPHRP